MRSVVVGPRRPLRLGHLSARRRLHLRAGHQRAVQSHQRPQPGSARAPACHGGLLLDARAECRDCLLRAQLLLQMRCGPRITPHPFPATILWLIFWVFIASAHAAMPVLFVALSSTFLSVKSEGREPKYGLGAFCFMLGKLRLHLSLQQIETVTKTCG